MRDTLRVLVVEDEAAILMQLEMAVEDVGNQVVGTAMQSSDAIALVDRERPSLVLLDLNLADGATGLQVASAARDAGADIVFMTANPLQIADFEGALGVLAKPFSRTAVSATLKFVTQCIRTPPPTIAKPSEFTMAATAAGRVGFHLRETSDANR